jgi:hypothetical protein
VCKSQTYSITSSARASSLSGTAERLRGLQVENQLDFHRLLDREVGRFGAPENFPGENADPVVRIGEAIAVAH